MSAPAGPSPSLLPIATWPEGAWLGRVTHPRGLSALERLPGSASTHRPPIHLDGQYAVFLYLHARHPEPSAALVVELPLWDTHAFICWIGSRHPLRRSIARRLGWWTWNEAWWRPGSIQMPWQVAHWLCEDAVERVGREAWPDQLDDQCLGSSIMDPEGYQLLEEPPPPRWPLAGFVAAYRALDHGAGATNGIRVQ